MDKSAKSLWLIAACVLGVSFSAGCRQKSAPVTAVPSSAEAAKAQARNKQVQQYITKRRAQARKASKTHTVH